MLRSPLVPADPDVLELTGRIHADFAYASGSTTVRTTLAEVLERRRRGSRGCRARTPVPRP